MRAPLAVLLAFMPGIALAQTSPHVSAINPPLLSKATGYTHVMTVTGGTTVYVAGQVALDEAGTVVGAGDMRVQAEQVFRNLETALKSAGASFRDVVKMTTFVTDMSQASALRDVRSRYLSQTPPASTMVQVVHLARPEFMLEIEAIAVVPSKPSRHPATR